MGSLIARTVGSLVLPFIQVFGLYVAFHGHLSPGGGFAGGTIIGASFVLMFILDLPFANRTRLHGYLTLIESGAVITFVLIGAIGILVGTGFLTNLAAGFPKGEAGRLLSGGFMLLIGLAICLKVASTIATLFSAMAEEESDH